MIPPLHTTSTAAATVDASRSSPHVDISCFTHTPCYCEENVYLLCKKLSQMGLADPKGLDLFVIFISNKEKQVQLWHQKASRRDDGLVLWDYHVICIQPNKNREGDRHLVWDLDSSLPFPLPLNEYVREAIQPSLPLYATYRRLFRVIHAPVFLHFFASDRSHMRDSHGSWISPPPAYEPIISEDGTVSNLCEYIQISATDVMSSLDDLVDQVFSKKLGAVVGETQLEDLFSRIHKR